MKKTKNNQAFTLVELIIVITILSILATVAFVSFQWYTRDSRNAKRNMEIWNLEKQIELSQMQWVGLFSMVKGTWSTITATWGTTFLRIWWVAWYENLSWSYIAWDINHTVLWLDPTKFLDPLAWVPYKIWVTTHGNRYQVAATIETDVWGDSLIKWSYFARTSARNRVPLDSSLNNTGSTILNIQQWISFIESGLLIWDRVEVASGSISYKIVWVNGNVVTLDTPLMSKWQNLYLSWDETRHLIKRWRSNQAIDTQRSDNEYTPYKFN
jgi:prepilin-type N-terminal cleavage/methylation domain-containing protein